MVRVGVRFSQAHSQQQDHLAKRGKMTPTSPIIEAVAVAFLGGLLGCIAIVLAYDCIRVVIGWFK